MKTSLPRSAQAKEGENSQDNDDQTDQINQTMHFFAPITAIYDLLTRGMCVMFRIAGLEGPPEGPEVDGNELPSLQALRAISELWLRR
jgi:hypothetical protein